MSGNYHPRGIRPLRKKHLVLSRGPKQPPPATLLSVAIDPVVGNIRLDVVLHAPMLDDAAFANTIAYLIRSLLTPPAGSVRVDVYSCPFDAVGTPLSPIATACATTEQPWGGVGAPPALVSQRGMTPPNAVNGPTSSSEDRGQRWQSRSSAARPQERSPR